LLAAAFIAANSPRACHCPAYQLTAFSNSAEPGHRRRLAVLDKRNALLLACFYLLLLQILCFAILVSVAYRNITVVLLRLLEHPQLERYFLA